MCIRIRWRVFRKGLIQALGGGRGVSIFRKYLKWFVAHPDKEQLLWKLLRTGGILLRVHVRPCCGQGPDHRKECVWTGFAMEQGCQLAFLVSRDSSVTEPSFPVSEPWIWWKVCPASFSLLLKLLLWDFLNLHLKKGIQISFIKKHTFYSKDELSTLHTLYKLYVTFRFDFFVSLEFLSSQEPES